MPRPDPRWPQWSTDLCLRHANLIGAAVFQVHCSTGVSPGTLFWDARSGRETSFKSLPLPALPSLLPLFSNGGETGHSSSRQINLPTNGYITSGFFHHGQKGMDGEGERENEGGREGERFPRLHFVRISVETVPGTQIALVSPTLPFRLAKGKRNEREKASS